MNDISIADIGGHDGKAIDRGEHIPSSSERHIDAMMMLLMRPDTRAWQVDELRRAMEELVPDFYEGSAYYERWVAGMRDLLLEKGLVTPGEVAAKLQDVMARAKAKA